MCPRELDKEMETFSLDELSPFMKEYIRQNRFIYTLKKCGTLSSGDYPRFGRRYILLYDGKSSILILCKEKLRVSIQISERVITREKETLIEF